MTHNAPTTRALNRSLRRRCAAAPGLRPGFTLIELLVAIGILALVSIGLAVIFGAIGETVSEGRRASTLNRAAERIENQLRTDLERMTRDGYLVISQRYASQESTGSGEPNLVKVKLSPRDSRGRERRVDEIMFFARGDFVSRRTPLVSGVQATANEAAIYYGIGQKRVPDLETRLNSPQNFFFNPFPTDSNLESTSRRPYAPLLGVPEPSGAAANPNRYAQDWSLLRQVTLLTTPNLVAQTPSEVFGIDRDDELAAGTRLLQDSARQIAFQPASRSLFNSLCWTDLTTYQNPPGSVFMFDGISRWWIGDVARFPSNLSSPALRSMPAWRSSGVVDIAQTRIADVRRTIRSLAAVGVTPGNYYPSEAVRPFNPRPARTAQSIDGFNLVWLDPTTDPAAQPTPASAGTLNLTTDGPRLRAWAFDSMPSLWGTSFGPPQFLPQHLAGVRYEDTPTRLVYEGDEFADTDDGRLARAIAEANQEMLTAQVFVPRVTEFIVEWSYGTVDSTLPPTNPAFQQMQWFGIPRATRDDDRNGTIDLRDHEADPSVRRYSDAIFGTDDLWMDASRDLNRVMVNQTIADREESPDFAVFGFTDPAGDADPDNDIAVDWPKFLRFTISIADPEDQETERTFQFVFAVPGEQG